MRVLALTLLSGVTLTACGGEFSASSRKPGADSGAGGTSSNGGGSATGGQHTGGVSSGGRPGSGGTPPGSGGLGSGGTQSSGGVTASGGSTFTGGTIGAGGSPDPCANIVCSLGFDCCGGKCVTPVNDPKNCGKCGNTCPDSAPLCSSGGCTVPSCGLAAGCGSAVCCGDKCCTSGTICCESQGPVSGVLSCQDPSLYDGTCPPANPLIVCASPDTPIATPGGSLAIATLRVGDHVLSVDHGRVVDVPIVSVGRRLARHHSVVHVELSTGAVLEISAPHPTADGRTFGDLRAGDTLSGARVEQVAIVPYGSAYTYDILPASDSGTYFAAGALIGSTLGGTALAAQKIDYAPLSVAE